MIKTVIIASLVLFVYAQNLQRVRWVWKNDPDHFLIKQGDGNFTEYKGNANPIDYNVTQYSTDSILILVNNQQKDRTNYVKVTDTMAYFSDSLEGLDRTMIVYPGGWDPEGQEDWGIPRYPPWRDDPSRILGGTEAKPHSWPWAVYIEIKYPSKTETCGGSIISNIWILTAAHCFKSDEDMIEVRVFLGVHSRSQKGEGIRILSAPIIHEDFDNDIYLNDIALLKLPNVITFTSVIQPVGLPQGDYTKESTKLTVVGWGVTEIGGTSSDKLMQVDLAFLGRTVCDSFYDFFDDTAQICCGSTSGKKQDTCSGDSGGPLMTPRVKFPNQFIQIGIVSFGPKEVECNGIGVYTSVFPYIGWIKEKISNKVLLKFFRRT